jgi:hypothetical protein
MFMTARHYFWNVDGKRTKDPFVIYTESLAFCLPSSPIKAQLVFSHEYQHEPAAQRSGYLEKIAVNLLTGAAVLVLGIG